MYLLRQAFLSANRLIYLVMPFVSQLCRLNLYKTWSSLFDKTSQKLFATTCFPTYVHICTIIDYVYFTQQLHVSKLFLFCHKYLICIITYDLHKNHMIVWPIIIMIIPQAFIHKLYFIPVDNWNNGKVVLTKPVMLYLSTRSLCVHYCIYFHPTDRIA